ncbi:efflux transporter outer membrane subunit [Pokkaliibacter plantistimulans]|uniref:efflux transporter outer membrane subunit n=1 Tax=Pokkaliibacter plantistimulans TaxID=1635171 RepID=UPI00269BB087|nr:efflux transporter outer membrane subunit [Pokkaliibacter plantistimulans]
MNNPINNALSVKYPLRLLGIALLALGLSGCAGLVRTDYQRPQVELPAQWTVQPDSGDKVLAAGQWWQVFNDPLLNELIEKALQTNNDLAAATIKVRKARLQAGLEATNLTPDVTVSASSSKERDLNSGTEARSSSTSTSLSYELDLWGKLAASRDSAEWEASATEQDRADTALTLIGTTADLYWQIAYLNQAIRSSEQSIAYTQRSLEVVRVKYSAGAVTNLDLLQAEQNVESQKADLADLQQQLTEAQNALAILFNQAPEHVMATPQQLSSLPMPTLQASVPAAVLANRPDLRAAEMRLRESLADADSTRASYYPSFSLTAALGTSSTQLLNLLQNPVATLGAGLSLPFVEWNQARLNTQIADATYQQAVVAFRQSLYSAMQDVENALSARKHYQQQEAALQRSYDLARQAEQVAETRYRAGATGVQDWLDQQETRRTAELALVKNRYNQLSNMMTLYQALGGAPQDLTSNGQ